MRLTTVGLLALAASYFARAAGVEQVDQSALRQVNTEAPSLPPIVDTFGALAASGKSDETQEVNVVLDENFSKDDVLKKAEEMVANNELTPEKFDAIRRNLDMMVVQDSGYWIRIKTGETQAFTLKADVENYQFRVLNQFDNGGFYITVSKPEGKSKPISLKAGTTIEFSVTGGKNQINDVSIKCTSPTGEVENLLVQVPLELSHLYLDPAGLNLEAINSLLTQAPSAQQSSGPTRQPTAETNAPSANTSALSTNKPTPKPSAATNQPTSATRYPTPSGKTGKPTTQPTSSTRGPTSKASGSPTSAASAAPSSTATPSVMFSSHAPSSHQTTSPSRESTLRPTESAKTSGASAANASKLQAIVMFLATAVALGLGDKEKKKDKPKG